MTNQRLVGHLLSESGVRIGGSDPWDIQVRDERFYARVLKDGSLGLGESYMEGWWDCARVDEFICRLLKAELDEKVAGNFRGLVNYVMSRLFNHQSLSRASIVARRHYDLGNDLFFSFLDPFRQYSCAYFDGTNDLADAQQKKLELICRKLDLRPGERVLDIGCGWGGFARYAAQNYGCNVTGVNISREQVRFAREFCRDVPVDILYEDYRQVQGKFDKIVSVGMFEHVGQKNYHSFMDVAHRCLKKDGRFLLHTIGSNRSRVKCDPWINRYIFPNAMLPSIAQIGKAAEGRFVVEHVENLALHYKQTLVSWNDRFQKAWNRLCDRYDRTFKRQWEYYLLSCAAAFCARDIQVWQVVMTRGDVPLHSTRASGMEQLETSGVLCMDSQAPQRMTT